MRDTREQDERVGDDLAKGFRRDDTRRSWSIAAIKDSNLFAFLFYPIIQVRAIRCVFAAIEYSNFTFSL